MEQTLPTTNPQDAEDTWENLFSGKLPVTEVFRRSMEQTRDFMNDPATTTRTRLIPAIAGIAQNLKPAGAFISDLARRNTSPANSYFTILNKPAAGSSSIPPLDRSEDLPFTPGR